MTPYNEFDPYANGRRDANWMILYHGQPGIPPAVGHPDYIRGWNDEAARHKHLNHRRLVRSVLEGFGIGICCIVAVVATYIFLVALFSLK